MIILRKKKLIGQNKKGYLMKKTISAEQPGNRTLIQRMGFNDSDRKEIKHDLACHYLIQNENIEKIVKLYNKNAILKEKEEINKADNFYNFKGFIESLYSKEGRDFRYDYCQFKERREEEKELIEINRFSSNDDEILLAKECLNKYKEKILFNYKNVLEEYTYKNSFHKVVKLEEPIKGYNSYIIGFADIILEISPAEKSQFLILIEVKINNIGIGEILRQLKFYKETLENNRYFNHLKIILAHTFILNKKDADVLISQGVKPIYLGNNFESWCNNIKENNTFNEVEI
jgi:hypothetical protein